MMLLSRRKMTDPWVMYLVVRKDVPLGRGRGMALAGAGAVACVDVYGRAGDWVDAFQAWGVRPRKVALRAGGVELDALREALDGVTVRAGGEPVLLCLPPRRRSASEPALAALRPYTDPPRGAPPDGAPAGPPLRYVVPEGVLRTTGKAMAQAGHAALECVAELGGAEPHRDALLAWRRAEFPSEVRLAGAPEWDRVRALAGDGGGVVVSDAGLTQVAPGTETVAAFPPQPAAPAELADLPVLP